MKKQQLMQADVDKTDGAGNARALTQITECEKLFKKYTAATASEIIAKACHRGGAVDIQAQDVPSALKFIKALRSPKVDIRVDRVSEENKVQIACAEMIDTAMLTLIDCDEMQVDLVNLM